MKTIYPKNINIALLFLRIIFASAFLFFYGLPKLKSGEIAWENLGASMQLIGIYFIPKFWGFMAMFSELFGALCLYLGIFFRVSIPLLLFTLVMAAMTILSNKPEILRVDKLIEIAAVLIFLLITGPGAYSIRGGFCKTGNI